MIHNFISAIHDEEFISGHNLYELLEINSRTIVNVNLKYHFYIKLKEKVNRPPILSHQVRRQKSRHPSPSISTEIILILMSDNIDMMVQIKPFLP